MAEFRVVTGNLFIAPSSGGSRLRDSRHKFSSHLYTPIIFSTRRLLHMEGGRGAAGWAIIIHKFTVMSSRKLIKSHVSERINCFALFFCC